MGLNRLDQMETRNYRWAQMRKALMEWTMRQTKTQPSMKIQKMCLWQALVQGSAKDHEYIKLEFSWA